MIETNLQHEDIINAEPMLEDHLQNNQVDYQSVISKSYQYMVQDIKNQNLEIRKLCKKLWLQETLKTTTSAFNSAESKEDRVERLRWVIVTSSLSGTAIFTLQGRNASNETWSDVKTIQIDQNGIHKYLVLEVRPNVELEIYKYYRIQKKDSTSTVTYKSYLVELTYENLHLWKALAMIFQNLKLTGEDIFEQKSMFYGEKYAQYLLDNRYYYDSDDDGEIDEGESESDYRSIRLGRG